MSKNSHGSEFRYGYFIRNLSKFAVPLMKLLNKIVTTILYKIYRSYVILILEVVTHEFFGEIKVVKKKQRIYPRRICRAIECFKNSGGKMGSRILYIMIPMLAANSLPEKKQYGKMEKQYMP